MQLKEAKNKISQITSNGLFSMTVALLFALYNGYIGIAHSYAFGIGIAIYYVALALTTGMLYIVWRRNAEKELSGGSKLCFAASVLLLCENVALVVPIALMVRQQRDVNLGLIAAITVATYATYKITMAIIHYTKTRRDNDVRAVTLRSVKLVDAIVSVLTLQNTLISVNATADEDMFTLTAWTSAALYVVIVVVSVNCLVRNVKALRS